MRGGDGTALTRLFIESLWSVHDRGELRGVAKEDMCKFTRGRDENKLCEIR
jgi:hypothetical protein